MTKEKKFNVVLTCLILTIVTLLIVASRIGDHPSKITTARLVDLEAAVIAWSKENGKPPASLDKLGLSEDALVDHIGTPFLYATEGSKVSISALGGDRKVGGIMFKADRTINFDTK